MRAELSRVKVGNAVEMLGVILRQGCVREWLEIDVDAYDLYCREELYWSID